MNKWLKRYAPVGMDVSGELGIMIMLLFFESGLRILQFKGTLWEDVLRACYRVHNEEAYELIEGSSMPDYLPMLRNCYNPPYVF